jgi:hypothetical protein
MRSRRSKISSRTIFAIAVIGAIAFGMSNAASAQTSMGGFEQLPSVVAPMQGSTQLPPPLNLPQSPSPQSGHGLGTTDFVPDLYNKNQPAPDQGNNEGSWGAIAFTADGSYASIWKMPSKAEAEAEVAKKCAQYGHGGCQTVTFTGPQCVALASFNGPYRGRRWTLAYTDGGMTYPEAQNAAMGRCNSDERTRGRCQPRTVACDDGR